MHEHKQNQCKRKVKHRKNVMGLIIFCITVGIAFMFTYYQNLRKEISARQKWLETVLTGEKKWILENQGPEGEIYMNGSKAGDVNPYFACIAALGLLAETENCPITETEKKAVGRYLDWHTGILLETDGKMGIYRKESGKLIYKEKADSEDGYLGMYLFLMGKYLEKTEGTDPPEYWKKGISFALKKIQSLMQDGITQVSEENTTAYLMDNLEVWKGLYELELAGLEDTQAISEIRKKIQAQIEKTFWDDANQRWRIIGNTNTSLAQMVAYYNANNVYPEFYASSDAPSIEAFCQIYLEECQAEGLKAEVAFCQAMLETGFLRYGGDVQINQYNFAGLGATGNGAPGNSFGSVREGVRAQVQHLKAYASTAGLNNPCVDSRFKYVKRGTAPYVEWLGIQENPYGKGWATAKNYGYNIVNLYMAKLFRY